MKKIVLSLIAALLLCTMCMGFVACNKVGTISVYDFAKETEFSFGRFEEGERIGYGRRAAGERYDGVDGEATASAINPEYSNFRVLLWENDARFVELMNSLQNLYSANIEMYITEKRLNDNDLITVDAIRELSLSDHIERKKLLLETAYPIKRDDFYKIIEEIDVGEHYNPAGDDYNDKRRLLKKEVGEDYVVGCFVQALSGGLKYYDEYMDSTNIKFIIYVCNKRTGNNVMIESCIEMFWYFPEILETYTDYNIYELIKLDNTIRHSQKAVQWLFDAVSPETLFGIAESYYENMEEVAVAWLNDPRGQAHLNKYYNR